MTLHPSEPRGTSLIYSLFHAPLPRFQTLPQIKNQNPKSKNRRYNPLILIALLVLPNPQADCQKLLSSKHYHKSKSKIQNPKTENTAPWTPSQRKCTRFSSTPFTSSTRPPGIQQSLKQSTSPLSTLLLSNYIPLPFE